MAQEKQLRRPELTSQPLLGFLLLLFASCGAPARQYTGELVGPPKPPLSALRAPAEWQNCNKWKVEAATAAGECNEEINQGCDEQRPDKIRQKGDCPRCDALDSVNEKLKVNNCWVNTSNLYGAGHGNQCTSSKHS